MNRGYVLRTQKYALHLRAFSPLDCPLQRPLGGVKLSAPELLPTSADLYTSSNHTGASIRNRTQLPSVPLMSN